MARTIDYLTLMVNVTPYEYQGHKYNALSIIVAFRKGRGFVVTWQPVQKTNMGYMTGPMPSSDPLVGGKGFTVKEATRNSVKVLETMKASLLLGQEGIKFFFDQRNYDALKEFMGDVCAYGYSEIVKKQLQETIANYNAMSQAKKEKAEPELSPMMKQFHNLKGKHPEAVLLFRCGDFYETYEEDAEVCARVLGITLTKSVKTGTKMAGFPYHALDTYLPKLIRAGHRVAICDQLEDPKLTKKLVKRGIMPNDNNHELHELNENNNNNPQNSQETMNLKIKNNNESANVQNAQVINPASAGVDPVIHSAEPIEDAEFEEITEVKSEKREVKSEQPKVTLKRKVTLKKKQPISEAQPAKFSIVPYTNKQGETGYFLFGFTSQEEAKGLADRMAKSVREGFRYENHTRYDVVGFPPRYAQMAQQMCDALNAGDAAAVAKIAASTFDVYAAAVADGKAESERRRAERKEAEAKAKAKEVAKVKKSAGLYSKEDVAAMMQTLLNGGDVPEDIKALLAKAA